MQTPLEETLTQLAMSYIQGKKRTGEYNGQAEKVDICI